MNKKAKCMYKQACYVTSVQGSKDKFVKLVLSFYRHLNLRNATQVPSMGRNAQLSLESYSQL